MIVDRTDYLFVDVPSSIRIDGGIMPARDVAGDGTWRVLRGEDPAFLAEALLERIYAYQLGADGDTWFGSRFAALQSAGGGALADRKIRARRLQEIAWTMRYELRPWYARSATLPTVTERHYPGTVRDQSAGVPPTDLNLEIAAGALASNPDDFARTGNSLDASGWPPLRADAVRALYYDMAQLRYPTARVLASESSDRGRLHVDSWAGGSPSGSVADATALEISMQTDAAGEPFGVRLIEASSVDVWIARAGVGGARQAERGVVADDLTAGATVLMQFYVTNTSDNVPALAPFSRLAKYVTLPVPATASSSRWTVGAADYVAAARTALLMCGVTPYESRWVAGIPNASVWQWVRGRYVATLSTLGDHTDFSNLNWGWRP